MGMELAFRGDDLLQPVLDRPGRRSRRQAGAVADAEDMGVDGQGRVGEGDVQHHIGGLAADPRQGLEDVAVDRHRAAMRSISIWLRRMMFLALVL